MSPSPTVQHQRTVRRLTRTLDEYIRARDSGEVFFAPMDVHLTDDTVVQPDVLYVLSERAGQIRTEEIAGAPDLVMEVVCSSTAHRDLTEKKRLYEEHGVCEYWTVGPNQETVEVFRNTDDGFVQHARVVESGLVSSALLEEFEIDLANLF